MSMLTKLFLIDDHELFRKALRQLVLTFPNMEVVGEANSGPDALAKLRTLQADVVLLDLSLKEDDGFNVAQRIAKQHANLPVLILTMHNEPQVVARAIKVGVAGYVTKDCAPAVLHGAILKVASGGHFLDPALVDSVVFTKLAPHRPFEQLSNREFQVLELLVEGNQITQIAESLSLSIKTVSTHKTRLMKKLNLHSMVELLHFAMRHGLQPNLESLKGVL